MDREAAVEARSSEGSADIAADAAEQLEKLAPPPADPVESAKAAGLIYVSHEKPGITRRRAGNGFTYIDEHGKPVRGAEELARIRALVIPPAWEDVWICPSPRGH